MTGRIGAIAAAAALVPLSLAWGSTAGASTTRITASTPGVARSTYKPPPIKHVWVIQLENEGYAQSFGNKSIDPYLAVTLPKMGAVLKNYYSIGHHSLDNYIAEISGQSPTTLTQEDCPTWVPFASTSKIEKPYDQVVGEGCVYPKSVETLGNQLTAKHLTWTAYMQSMGDDPARDDTTATKNGPACGHPPVGQPDPTEDASSTDAYAARHEGFMYFRSVIGSKAYCDAHILSFGDPKDAYPGPDHYDPLSHDLKSISTTPNFSWVTPNLCDDGHDTPCPLAKGHGAGPGGLKQVNTFLKTWVPKILASPAYKKNGLIVITFDEALVTDTHACCGETAGASDSHPNVTYPGLNSAEPGGGAGGGIVGALLISPFIKAKTVSTKDYNHYSLLRSIEDLFGLSHLGDAAMPQVPSFGKDVYTNWKG
jgi:phosphatidylinositol-3-phosphatase